MKHASRTYMHMPTDLTVRVRLYVMLCKSKHAIWHPTGNALQQRCNTLQHTSARCNTRRNTHCNTIQLTQCNHARVPVCIDLQIETQCGALSLRHTATTLQHTATQCNTHYCTHCNTIQLTQCNHTFVPVCVDCINQNTVRRLKSATHCNNAETHCNTLQHAATHYNTNYYMHCNIIQLTQCNHARVRVCIDAYIKTQCGALSLQHTATSLQHTATSLQHTATTLHNATHYQTLQHKLRNTLQQPVCIDVYINTLCGALLDRIS